MGLKREDHVKVLFKCRYYETFHKGFFVRENGKEIQLTIERLNATYVISREVKGVGVNITVSREHYGFWITGMVKTQGMAKLMNSN